MTEPVRRVLLGIRGRAHEVIVDAADAAILDAHRWRVLSNGYAYRADYSSGAKVWLLLHRVLAGAVRGDYVDHVNRDKLDNRRCNLRVCTHSQNLRNSKRPNTNTSGFKGVSFDRRSDRAAAPWMARIRVDGGRSRHLGSFATPEQAHAAYAAAATRFHGEFARTE